MMNSETRKKIAQDILAVAKSLVAVEQNRKMTAAEVTVELEKSAKACASLAQEFKDTHAGLIAEITRLDKELKDQKKVLSEYYNKWDKRSGYLAVKKEVMEQASQCLETGEMLEDLADDIQFSKNVSKQPSYQQQLQILLSMLNEAEMNKYKSLLANYFKMNLTTLKTGVSQLDGTVKEWHQEAQDIAAERGIKLPKASKMASAIDRAKERNAGILNDLMGALKSVIPNLVRKVTDWGQRLLKRITRNGEELNDITSDLAALKAKADKVLA